MVPISFSRLLFCVFLAGIIGIFMDCSGDGEVAPLPQKFQGAFKYNGSENWDEYLITKGYKNETVRKTVKLPDFTRFVYKLPNDTETYRYMIGQGLKGSKWLKGAKKNADWMFKLGQEFEGVYWNGNRHNITYTYDPEKEELTEKHINLNKTNAKPEVYRFTIDPQNNLVMTVDFKGGELKHHYVRTD